MVSLEPCAGARLRAPFVRCRACGRYWWAADSGARGRTSVTIDPLTCFVEPTVWMPFFGLVWMLFLGFVYC